MNFFLLIFIQKKKKKMRVYQSLLEAAQSCDKFPYAFKSSEEMPVPFEYGDALIGHILPSVVSVLKEYNQKTPSPFIIQSNRVTFAAWVNSFEKRSEVIKDLADSWRANKQFPVLNGWRNELYPVYGNKEIVFVIERSATPLFGISTFGVHLNAYVMGEDGQIYMWIARRAKTKQTWPGLLDNCVRYIQVLWSWLILF